MVILKEICIRHTAAHCNTLQLIATHCNSLQLTATHCDTLQHTSRDGNIKRDMYSTHCSTLQLTATHYNTLQHTATHCNTHRVMVISKETCIPFTHSLHTTTLLLIYLTFQPYIHCKEPSIHSQKLPTRVPWHIRKVFMTLIPGNAYDSSMCVPWLMYMCVPWRRCRATRMTHPCVCHDSCICI